MVNVFGKKVVSSVLAVLILLSVFLTLPMTAENVNAAVSAPTNLKVTEYSDKAAKLSWSKVAGVTGYLVYYSKDNSNFTKLKTINSQSTTSYTVGGLTAGKAYYFALISYTDINGKITKSERTSSLKITATSSSSVPAPSNLKVAEYSNSAIKLTWTKASDVTGYYVYRSTDGKKYSKIKTLTAYTTTYTNTSLTAGQKYYYSIASYKNTSTGAVAIGPKSSAVNALTISSSKLSYPSGFAVKEVATDAIKLVWNKSSNASGYYIYRSIDNKNFSKIKALPSSSTSYTNTALYLDTTYYYKIASYVNSNGSIGLSAKSPAVNAKTTSTSVSFTSKTSTSTTITLNWDYPSATGYQIYRLDINTGKYVKIASTSAKSYTDKNLSSDRYYNYKVRAYLVSGGITTYSPYNSVSVRTCLPAVKDFKAVSQTYYSVKLSWTKQNGAVNYEIYQLSPDSQVYKLITTLNSDVTSYMVDNLTVNTTYKFRIRSVSSSKSYSDYSTLSITTLGATDDIIKANELYDEINKYRKSINLMQLKRDVSLDSIAITRAKEISQCFSDNRPDGTGWNTLLEEEGLGDYRFAGENIAKGMPDSASAVSVWLNRSVEGGNIREAIYTKIGVGVYCYRGVYHYVAIFYRPMKG
ncbi:fibronectin type III domain-containing protein [Pseudoruminococcus massiliensis]|uniref:fibronectin type III domain-containing protein n=1 Tax=Pseudoruminococcus massiliensis TaxID=2086583 RepID=UPI0040274C13